MGSRITPLGVGESPDPEVDQLLADSRDGWWEDAAMFGIIGRNPQMWLRWAWAASSSSGVTPLS